MRVCPVQSSQLMYIVTCTVQYSTYHTIPVRPFSSFSSPTPNRHPPFSFPAPPWLCTLLPYNFVSSHPGPKPLSMHLNIPGSCQGREISTNQIDSFRKHRHGSRELRLTRKISFPGKLTLMLTGTLTDNRRKTDRNVHLPVSGFLVGAKEGRRGEEEEEIRCLRFGRFLEKSTSFLDWHD